MISIYLAQVIVPVVLILWLALAPMRSWTGLVFQIFAAISVLLATMLVGILVMPPWWTPCLLAVALLAALTFTLTRRLPDCVCPRTAVNWLVSLFFLAVGVVAAIATYQALVGRSVPPGAIDLQFPLAGGTYLVVSGGNSLLINAHADALDQSKPAHRAYWGTGHGVDIVKINRWGLRARGIMPGDPSAYFVFATEVQAPCTGTIVAAVGNKADTPVPMRDPTDIPGNHIILRCATADVLLAHFRNGSLRIHVGMAVAAGDLIAEVGNSGASDEPHLHIHAQRPGTAERPFSGEPLPVTFAGRYLVRNSRYQAN